MEGVEEHVVAAAVVGAVVEVVEGGEEAPDQHHHHLRNKHHLLEVTIIIIIMPNHHLQIKQISKEDVAEEENVEEVVEVHHDQDVVIEVDATEDGLRRNKNV